MSYKKKEEENLTGWRWRKKEQEKKNLPDISSPSFEGQCDAKISFRVARGMRTRQRSDALLLDYTKWTDFRGIELKRLKNIMTYHCSCLNILIANFHSLIYGHGLIIMLFASRFLNYLVYFDLNIFHERIWNIFEF